MLQDPGLPVSLNRCFEISHKAVHLEDIRLQEDVDILIPFHVPNQSGQMGLYILSLPGLMEL